MIPSDSPVQNVLTALQDFYPDHKEGFRGGVGTIAYLSWRFNVSIGHNLYTFSAGPLRGLEDSTHSPHHFFLEAILYRLILRVGGVT